MVVQQYDGELCKDKVAIVTGASRGLGAAIARRLASEGALVACAARTLDPDPRYTGTLKETIEQIRADGGTAEAFQADISKTEDRHRLVQEVMDKFGRVDILVNNAAVTFFLDIDTFPQKRFDLMINVQVWSGIELAQLCIPSMRANGGGHILNISSRAAVLPQGPPFEYIHTDRGFAVYGLCKAALDRLSVGMAAELYKDNIAVNALAPWDNVSTPGAGDHDLVEDFRVEPEEAMAEAALMLCSGEQSRLTGRVAYSQPLLAELQRPVHSLTGGTFSFKTH